MSYPFFNNVLGQLNRRLKYDAAVGYAGNSFFKDSADLIERSNPLLAGAEWRESYGSQLAAMLNSGMVQVLDKTDDVKDEVADEFGLTFE